IQKHNKSFIRGCGCCSCTCQQEREQQSGPFRVSALQLRLHATEKGEPGKKSTKPPILILSLGPKQVSCTIAFPKTAWNASRTGLTFTSLSEATTISTSPPESTNHITIETIRESRLLEVTPPATPRTQPNNPALPSPPACSPASTATSGVAGLPPAPAKEVEMDSMTPVGAPKLMEFSCQTCSKTSTADPGNTNATCLLQMKDYKYSSNSF
ncbi:Protein of unknown function, partial [Gryllus bimaculatus]